MFSQAFATVPQLPASDPLSNVDFGAAYVGEYLSGDGMLSLYIGLLNSLDVIQFPSSVVYDDGIADVRRENCKFKNILVKCQEYHILY